MAFACVAIIVFVVGRYASSQAEMQRRLPVSGSRSQSAGLSENVVPNYFLASLVEKFDEKKFGIEGQLRTKLRRDLIRAGYFSEQAIRIYIFIALIGPYWLSQRLLILSLNRFQPNRLHLNLSVVAVSALIAVLGPDAYIARRQGFCSRNIARSFQISWICLLYVPMPD